MNERPLTLSAFYHYSWISLLTLAALLSWQADLFPLPLLLPVFACTLWCLVPSGRFLKLSAFPSALRFAAVSVFVAAAFARHVQHRDLAALLGTLLWASLLVFVPRKQKTFGHWIGLLVTGLISLMDVILRQEFYTHVVFLVFLLNLVFTLNANNLYSLAGPAGASRYRLSRLYFRQLVPALVWGLFGGGLVFFLFPRTQLFSNPWGLRERESSTGYTGQISLQSENAIREDATVALTVEADPNWLIEHGRTIYMRGNTLDQFDGTQWVSTELDRWPYRVGDDLRYTLTHSQNRVSARIYREPHSTRAILYPGLLLYFRGPESLLGGARYDAGRGLFRSTSGSVRYAYEVMVADVPDLFTLREDDINLAGLTKTWEKERARSRTQPRDIVPDERYLEVPAAIAFSTYFRDWSKEVLGGGAPTSVAKIVGALSANFSRKFTATLVHGTKAATPLEGFLSKDRQGHCEYFATAATLFLRTQGIPARVVLGYRGGTFNTVSKTLEIQERNAHAWVEIYGGRGRWYRYDPTPSFPLGDDTGALAQAANYYNALKFWFNRYIVHYDTSAQQQVWMQLSLMHGRRFQDVPKWMALLDLIKWVGLGLALWLFPKLLSQKRRRFAEHLPVYYRTFLKRLESAGWTRGPGETFRRFHDRLEREGWDPFSLTRLDEALHRDLYSPRPLKEEDAAALAEWVDCLPIRKKAAATSP